MKLTYLAPSKSRLFSQHNFIGVLRIAAGTPKLERNTFQLIASM